MAIWWFCPGSPWCGERPGWTTSGYRGQDIGDRPQPAFSGLSAFQDWALVDREMHGVRRDGRFFSRRHFANIAGKFEVTCGPLPDKVIREALRFMETHEDWIHEIKMAGLREQLKVGTDQLDRGEGIAIQSKAALGSLFEDIMG